MGRKYAIRDQSAWYYLTITTVEWVNLFTRIEYRDFLIENLKYCQKHKGLKIYGYVLMSNHLHLIVSARDSNLSDIIRDYKTFTSKELIKKVNTPKESRRNWMLRIFGYHGKQNKRNKAFQLWQQNNHPVEIQDEEMCHRILEYIHHNPIKAGLVNQAEHYPYSSASCYSDHPHPQTLKLDW